MYKALGSILAATETVWWCLPVTPELERWSQEDQEFKAIPGCTNEFEASLDYMRPCFKNSSRRAEHDVFPALGLG